MNASRALNKGLAGVLLLTIILAARLYACDMTAFVQSEFAERCQLLLDLCEKADLVRSIGHPDSKVHSGALSREWVRFYLAHGNHINIPPTLSFIATGSWNTGMNEIGMAVARVINTGIDRTEMNQLKFRIMLLKEPQRIERQQQVFAQRRKFVAENADKTDLENWQTWIDHALLVPANVLNEQVADNAELLHKLRTDVDSHLASFRRIIAYKNAGTGQEAVSALYSNLQQEINLDMSFWENLFFYSTR